MGNVINIDESRIKFKAFGFFPPAGKEEFSIQSTLGYLGKLTAKNMNTYIKRKKIADAVIKELQIIDGVRMEILTEFSKKDENGNPIMDEKRQFKLPEPGMPEMGYLNAKYNELMNQEITLPYAKFSIKEFKDIFITVDKEDWSMDVLDLLSFFIDGIGIEDETKSEEVITIEEGT